jgi:hypothetical protein
MGLTSGGSRRRAICAAILLLAFESRTIAEPAEAPPLPPNFRELAKASGEPQIPGLTIVYLHPLGSPADANRWQNIIVHQTEGPAGSAKSSALAQAKNPTKRGVMLWVETDGTVYWSTAENAIPTHGDGANRNDNKYIDNSKTYRSVVKTNSVGIELVGNYPDVAKPATPEQVSTLLLLVRFLRSVTISRRSISTPTIGSTIRTGAIARAAIWRHWRASSVTYPASE